MQEISHRNICVDNKRNEDDREAPISPLAPRRAGLLHEYDSPIPNRGGARVQARGGRNLVRGGGRLRGRVRGDSCVRTPDVRHARGGARAQVGSGNCIPRGGSHARVLNASPARVHEDRIRSGARALNVSAARFLSISPAARVYGSARRVLFPLTRSPKSRGLKALETARQSKRQRTS